MSNTLKFKKSLLLSLPFYLLALLAPNLTNASDHDESPLVKTDASMDITDLYVSLIQAMAKQQQL